MSLEKGNVVIDLNDKNSLKEDEKKKIKDNEVSDEQLDNFNFQELDKAIEKSFQDFLKKTLIQDRDSPESIQIQFNNWLDKECRTLDMMKESEIEQKIIGPVTFELTKDATRVELADLQKELLKNEKIKTEKDVNLKVGKEELIGLTKVYNNIDIQEIADLFSKNFKGREQLLDLLKTKTPDNIKKFQRIIVGITNPDSDSEDYKYKNGESPLSWFGVDGKFGKETLKAFKAYVDNNETTGENPVEPEITGNNSEGTVVSGENPEKAGDEIVASAKVDVTGTAIQEPVRGNPVVADTSNKESDASTIEIDQSEIDQYEYDINQLTELTEAKAKEIIEKENTFGKETITLSSLQKLTPEIAKTLASFEGKLYLNGLKELDIDTLEEFKNGKCSFVKFPGGELDKSDNFSIKTTDKTYSEITDEICNLLIQKTDNYGTGNGTTKSTSSDTSTSTRSTNTNNGTIGKSNQEQKNRTGGEDEPQIIEGNGTKVESQEMSGNPKELEAKLNGEIKNIASSLPEIRILSDGIYIPKSLGNSRGFNVIYNPELKPYIKKQVINDDGPEYFVVPSNIKIGLVTGILVPYLVLGDYEMKDGFNNLDSDSQVDGDPQKYNGSLTQTSLKTTKYTYTENISNEGGDNKSQTSTSEQQGHATSTENTNKKSDGFVEHIYEGIGYNVDNAEGFATTPEEAIKYLTLKKRNSELSIVDSQYYPEGEESRDLNKLSKYLLECINDPITIFKKIDNKTKDFGENENLNALYDLYRDCINDQNSNNKGPYLKRVIWLLRKYFVTGVYDKDENKINNFTDMYNNELIGKVKKMETRKFRAKRSLTTEDKELLHEWEGNEVNAVNTRTQLLLPSNTFKPFMEKYGFSTEFETQFAMCLCDLDANGRIDSADIDTKTGQELFNMIRDAKIDQSYGIIENGPMQNILGYAKEKSEKDGYTNTTTFLQGIDLSSSDEEILKKIQERPLTMQYLRLMLVNCPMNAASEIIHTGSTTIESEEKVKYISKFPDGYENFYAQETNKSIKNYADRLYSGEGMQAVESFVSENGYITEQAINYLNKKLSLLSPNGKVPEIGRESSNDTISLKIPKELTDYVNIPYDPDLGEYIKTYDEYFEIPANIKIGLLTYSRLYTGKYNLVLGSYGKEENFKLLGKGSKFTGEPSKHEGEPGESIMTESIINKELESLLNNENFPLYTCTEINEGSAYFEIKDGKSISIKNSEKLGISDDNKKLFVPEYGMLVITKMEDGTYATEFNDSVKNKLTVQYIDKEQPNEGEGQSIELGDIFGKYENLNNMFDGIEEALSTLDDDQSGNYASFMNFASNVLDDDKLDKNDYEEAFNELKNMLSVLNNDDLKDTKLIELKQKIEEGDLGNDEKMLIVDRFKMLFSYHIDLSKGENNGDYLSKKVAKRGQIYEGLKGYDTSEKFPLIGQRYRDKIVNKLKDEKELDKPVYPNLIGMTAFYKLGKGNEGRSYMMTEMGKTTVLGNTYEELTDKNLENAKNWFIKNLNKSDVHKEVLMATLNEKLKSMLNIENLELSNDNLESLLKGEELDIGIKIIKFNVKYMFYLLGECGNESIGVNLDQIIIKEKGTTIDINPNISYKDIGLAVDSVGAEGLIKGTSVREDKKPEIEYPEPEDREEERPYHEREEDRPDPEPDDPHSEVDDDGDDPHSDPNG